MIDPTTARTTTHSASPAAHPAEPEFAKAQRAAAVEGPAEAVVEAPPVPADSDRSGGHITRYQWYIALTATGGFALVTMDSSFFTSALTPVTKDLGVSAQAVGVLYVIIYAFAGLATYVVGWLMDMIGRRRAFQLSLLGTAVGSALTAAATVFPALVVFRAISQGGSSAEGVTGQTLVAENGARKHRGFLMGVQQAGYPIGWFIAAGLALIVLPTLGWRALFLVGLVPAVLAMIARIWVRETDRFEDVKKLRTEAQAHNRAATGGSDAGAAVAVQTRYAVDKGKATQSLTRQLFEPGLRRTTITMFFAMFFVATGSGTVLFFLPYLVEDRGFSTTQLNELIVTGTACGFAGYLAQGWLGDRVGRKWLVGISLLAGTVGILCLTNSTSFAALVVFEIVFWVFYMGAYAAFYGFLTESYPTRVRGTGVGFVTAAVWLGNAFAGGVFALLIPRTGVETVFLLGGCLAGLLGFGFIAMTRNVRAGSELEAITQ